jgi:transposase-like protein
MARNMVQFQKGMSLSEFHKRYGSEAQCEAALVAWRWPKGFVCPHCGGREHAIVGKRRLFSCHGCRRQTSIRAGTVFAKSLLPLTTWFQAMWLLTQSKNSISTLELSRQIGVKWDSAWLMRQKLASVMIEREKARKLDGRVEMDDAVLGGEKSEIEGGKRGRSGPNKVPFVIAVETTDDAKPRRLLLHAVKAHDGDSIEAMARAHLEPGARVVSDGLGCFRAVTRAGCKHDPVNVTKAENHGEKLACFRWVNTVLGNLKTAVVGTLKSVRPRYAFRYLGEFQYRFNRRFDLPAMFDRIAYATARAAPRPYSTLKVAYVSG